MAKRQKIDRALESRLDEFENRLFQLKIVYEKYFSGLEKVEPLRERDDLRRMLRDLLQEPVQNTVQRHRLQMLRARFNSFELYWQRNLVMIERGTHPRMKFRAQLHERERAAEAAALERSRRQARNEREERAFTAVYRRFIEARRKCGQSTEIDYGTVRAALKKQVRALQSRYQCRSVKFRVTIEDGKAKVKAVPMR